MIKHFITVFILGFFLLVIISWDSNLTQGQIDRWADGMVMDEFKDISENINAYYKVNKKLPITLSDLEDSENGSTYYPYTDVDYKKVSESSYELCYNFKSDSISANYHKGYSCINYKVKDIKDSFYLDTYQKIADKKEEEANPSINNIENVKLSSVWKSTNSNLEINLKNTYLSYKLNEFPGNDIKYLLIEYDIQNLGSQNIELSGDDYVYLFKDGEKQDFSIINELKIKPGEKATTRIAYEVDDNLTQFILIIGDNQTQKTIPINFNNAKILNGELSHQFGFKE